MKREDIAAALAAVAVIKVTAAKGGVTEERKNATILAAEMLDAGTWETDATLAHAVALAVQAAQEWKQLAPLMDNAKKAANKGLYALREASADSISTLDEDRVDWKISSAPQQQAIGAEDNEGGKFNKASGQALAADITCPCPSGGQTNECIKIQSGGNVITSAVTDKRTAIELWRTLKKYCIASMRGRATQGSILASIAHLKAMLGTNTGGSTTGEGLRHMTHALGKQANPSSETQGIKFVTYGAYAEGVIPWEQELIEASGALDKARRLAERSTNAADLALGLVKTWQESDGEALNTHKDQNEAHETEEARARDKRGNTEGTQENDSSETEQECIQKGGKWNEGRCQRTQSHAESADAHTDNAHNIQPAMRAGMMLAALVVKTPA
ncbi:variant surface glycoprotein, (VSG), putative [Trypanosoma vivax Y486]|uniref:Variant surface glycoprotein, (VSG), putative n=1 Tax=Trypanosoma vivax (strain Y486) TaxID=1055687 RepID=F9WSK7_TRYVY|nr:variant surface glycoprotein, (VSG), putative [Trypanosoma vivax Y486]|eukprot:CCD20546.1 variant surface glycoprotein, (VSG), putative [Trypanosoma vivax Y486]